ncbi:hypothetical protein CEXT_199171 [Caerostris extrusa]|uniref:Secreted protein n=1 Tax=Caerostris extrusa TaxID=172846 RepID=A0AAV4WRZ8_CAEEX|nr:hypothetical protein CEXT_199171 [Caerostris extrusa]
MPRTLMRRPGRPLMLAASAPLSCCGGLGGDCRTKEGGRTKRGWEGGTGTSPTNNQKTAANEVVGPSFYRPSPRAPCGLFLEIGAEFQAAVRGSAEKYDLSDSEIS